MCSEELRIWCIKHWMANFMLLLGAETSTTTQRRFLENKRWNVSFSAKAMTSGWKQWIKINTVCVHLLINTPWEMHVGLVQKDCSRPCPNAPYMAKICKRNATNRHICWRPFLLALEMAGTKTQTYYFILRAVKLEKIAAGCQKNGG